MRHLKKVLVVHTGDIHPKIRIVTQSHVKRLYRKKSWCVRLASGHFWEELVSSDVPGEDGGVLEPWEDVQIEAGPLDTFFFFHTVVISCYFT